MEPYHIEPDVRSFETTITSLKDGKFIGLEKTYFYPRGGGQPHDEGILIAPNGTEYPIVFVGKFDGAVSHEVDATGKPPLEVGMRVRCIIDDARRSHLMRLHTAAHIVSAVIAGKTGANITGNQLALEKVRIDFSTPDFDPEAFAAYIEEANEVMSKEMDVVTSEISHEKMDADPSLSKLAKGFPAHIKHVRIVDIGNGYDKQACGGTHVSNTKHIGRVELLKVENKGAKNRRVYFKLA